MQLLEMLSVLIAFVVVMLMLSLVVTSGVQATLHLAGMRARNLKWGLQHLFQKCLGKNANDAGEDANRVINSVRTPTGTLNLPNRMLNPPLTWIEPDDLLSRLKQANVQAATDRLVELKSEFSQLEEYLSNRFTYHTRLVTIGWAVLVGIAFQISVPELLQQLSRDRDLREQLVAQAESVYAQAQQILDELPSYESVADRALEELQTNHPEHAELLEEAVGIGSTQQVLLDELEQVLADLPVDERAALVEEYAALLEKYHGEAVEQAAAAAGTATSRLVELDFAPWRHGPGYYFNGATWQPHWEHLGGVLLTIVMLTFGAPFWFEMLGSLLKLRDLLSPPKPETA